MTSIKNILFIILFTIATNVIAQSVYTTKTGEKYHKESCHYLKYSKKEYPLEKALELNYEACKVCKPPLKITNSGLKKKKNNSLPTKKAVATQCTGKTQKGKRCKRMTKNSNGRCYQH